MRRFFGYFWLLFFVLSGLFISCKKDSFITRGDARLNISADSLKFDTVFISTGSVTRSFKIFNENDQKLRISKIQLMGGAPSPFKINVNGIAAPIVTDIEIAANDSIYVFVSVNINPNTANLPFLISDSIQVNYNGNTRLVHLEAFGQNAIFLRNTVISANTSWNNALPYVILGGLRVDSNVTLTIPAGCRIFAHADAPFIIDGTLLINGTFAQQVNFRGDRLDNEYRNLPASWPGIYFRRSSKDNILNFTNIRNAYQAIVVQEPASNANPKLRLQQCQIDNSYDVGILCINSSLHADNSLVSNCGTNVALSLGGNYQFTHCTLAGYSNTYLNHKNPVLIVNNFGLVNGGFVTANLNAIFRNNIFWGDAGFVDNEVTVNKQGSNTFSVVFENNLYRVLADPANSTLTNNIKNQEPLFDSLDVFNRYFDFRTSKNAAAPGIDKGVITALQKDLDNRNRNFIVPDLGCYEKQ